MANVCQNTLTLLEMVTMPTKDEDIQKFVGVSPDLEANFRILSLQVSFQVGSICYVCTLGKFLIDSKVRYSAVLWWVVMTHSS